MESLGVWWSISRPPRTAFPRAPVLREIPQRDGRLNCRRDPGNTTPADKQPSPPDLVICSAPRGAPSCAWPRRGPVRAAASLAAAPVPPVARAERSWAIGPKPQTISTRESKKK